jgi:cytochrome c oxidase assembly factor CtaG
MLQHMLLQMVAPPLIVVGAPWMLVWRPLPLGLRRRLSRGVICAPAGRPVRAAARLLGAPAAAWLLFVGAIVLSHLPRVFDYALRHGAFHEGEHLAFLVLGVLFWSRAIDSPPFRSRVTQLPRVGFFVGAALVETLLALVILAVHTPLYSRLGTLLPAPHQLSAIEDQQLGGAIMLEPASIPLLLAIVWSIGRWLADRAEREAPSGVASTRGAPTRQGGASGAVTRKTVASGLRDRGCEHARSGRPYNEDEPPQPTDGVVDAPGRPAEDRSARAFQRDGRPRRGTTKLD